jgi:hypothetical protein
MRDEVFMNEQEQDRILIQELVREYIYLPENPDWANLQAALYRYDFTMTQVYNILQDVRDGVY